ncbi:MAG: hypothetical protein U0Y68_23860 [Blastocatellia bacterium]
MQKVLQLAVDYGVITANPARGITSLRELPRDRVLTHAEETRLVERLTVSPRRRMLALAVRFALLAYQKRRISLLPNGRTMNED